MFRRCVCIKRRCISGFCISRKYCSVARMDLAPLTQAEYDAHIANNSLRIAFVGMSDVGKSYRSKVLRDQSGFDWYQVDILDTDRNLVFDTTGSVIYLEKPTTQWLQENCLIVNLEAGEKYINTMIQKFFEQPKPVVWSGMYVQKRGETQKETLERCFPVLLRDRLKKYRAMAHVNVPATDLYDKSGRETIAIIRSYLPA